MQDGTITHLCKVRHLKFCDKNLGEVGVYLICTDK